MLSLVLAGAILSAAEVPYLSGRINDYAMLLSSETRRVLDDSLKVHETRTGNQIVVLTIPTLDGESIEDYAIRVFDEWKPGQKERDNGILIIVVPNDRQMRIEVGYGLEPVITDGMAGQIIRTVMTPRFRSGDFNSGILDGTLAVIDVLEGGALTDEGGGGGAGAGDSNGLEISGPDLSLKMRILLGAFIFGVIGLFTIIGIMTPGAGWFLYLFLIPFWAMFPIVVVGTEGAFACLITYLIGFPVAKLLVKRSPRYKTAMKNLRTKGSASIGGFTFSTRGSGSSWSSGSSGGSSFSGGGGSSGGGGASGSW
jgi:uncharacterized protein